LLSLDLLCNTVGLARLYCLARFLDLLEHFVVGERVFGNDLSVLLLERDVVRFDTYRNISRNTLVPQNRDCIPSSFFRTRSTAPEQPPQLMAMSNLYVCSAISDDFEEAYVVGWRRQVSVEQTRGRRGAFRYCEGHLGVMATQSRAANSFIWHGMRETKKVRRRGGACASFEMVLQSPRLL
jgi:hypothetical protein